MNSEQFNPDDVVDRIFIHACHTKSTKYNSEDDAIFVKEKLVMKDGSLVDNHRRIENYERSFWITKPPFRNHNQKKERELIDHVTEFKTTERLMPVNIKRAMGNFYLGETMRDICNNPYIYGTDIPVESLVKKDYDRARTTGKNIKLEYGAYDIETYMADPVFKDDPIMATTVTNKLIHTTVHAHFLRQFGNRAEGLIRAKLQELLGEHITTLGLTFELEIVDDPGIVARRSIEKIHEIPIDIVAIWNMDFDIPRIIDTLCKYGHSPELVFSDPNVPKEFASFEYHRGPTSRKADSGKITPIAFHERWNSVAFPAKWTVLDAMHVYWRLRKVDGNESGGYGLDAVLNRNINMGKLKFEEADGYVRGAWHIFMQNNYPIEYIVYNIFDCLGMVLLDNKTKDIQLNFPLLCGITTYKNYSSNPKKFCDELHFDVLDNVEDEGSTVLGSTGRNMLIDEDEGVVDKRGWVMTLPSFMMERRGVNFIDDIQGVPSNVYIHVSDLDIEGTYPSEQVAFNMSKETTRYEVIEIEGVDWDSRRRLGVQLNAGEANAGSLGVQLFGLPHYCDLLDMFENQ